MWQHHYLIHAMRMDALRAEAEREHRWRRADEENGRSGRSTVPGRVQSASARFAAAVARFADRAARRLDARAGSDLGSDRLVSDA